MSRLNLFKNFVFFPHKFRLFRILFSWTTNSFSIAYNPKTFKEQGFEISDTWMATLKCQLIRIGQSQETKYVLPTEI